MCVSAFLVVCPESFWIIFILHSCITQNITYFTLTESIGDFPQCIAYGFNKTRSKIWGDILSRIYTDMMSLFFRKESLTLLYHQYQNYKNISININIKMGIESSKRT